MAGKAEYKNKWQAEKLDRINLTVPKGKKDIIKAHADRHDNGSATAFINRAIDETMERDEDGRAALDEWERARSAPEKED